MKGIEYKSLLGKCMKSISEHEGINHLFYAVFAGAADENAKSGKHADGRSANAISPYHFSFGPKGCVRQFVKQNGMNILLTAFGDLIFQPGE